MGRLIIGKIVMVIGLIVLASSAYYNVLLPFGIIGGFALFCAGHFIESQVYALKGFSLRDAVIGIFIFILLFRLIKKLQSLGVDVKELIFGDIVNICCIIIGIIVYLAMDISQKRRQIRCSGVRSRLKGLS